MKEIVTGCAITLLILCLINYGVDFAFYLMNRYCRFHIGRWEKETWKSAVEKTAVKWLKRTPTVKITDNCRYMLFDIMNGKYRSKTIQSWQKAALILGLLESDKEKSQIAARTAAVGLLDERGNWKVAPIAVDCGMLSYAILRATNNRDKVKPAMDAAITIIQKNINEDGLISYTGGKDNPDLYVDTIGLACPFLALYAWQYGEKKWEDVAFHQLQMFHQYGLYQDSALPNHAYHAKSKLPLGVYGWGRGTAWYVIGLVDTFEAMQNEAYRSQLYSWIREAAESYLRFQRADGGFGSILQRTTTYDSSSTAALAWFYQKAGLLLNDRRYENIAEKCFDRLRESTRITGAIDWCQGDTKDIGVFAQTYDTMPFAQGMVLRALHTHYRQEAYEKKDTD